MIRAMMTANGQCGRILIAPNRAANYSSNLLFLCGIGLFCLMIGAVFSMVGAWVVWPFIIGQLIVLTLALHWLMRKLECSQLIVLGVHKVVITHWQFRAVIDRDRATLLLERSPRYTDWPKLLLAGSGKAVPLGDFLNEKESLCLQQLLREAGLNSVWQQVCQRDF